MVKIKVIKLGTKCVDKAIQHQGMVTHLFCNMEKRINYLFQPRVLNPENGLPVKSILVEQERLDISLENMEEIELPFEILGTPVTDEGTGFTGMAVEFVRHLNGCFHIIIQPSGLLKSTNSPVQKAEFDPRRCSGPMIKQMSDEEFKKSLIKDPSPTGDSFVEDISQYPSMT